VDSARICAGELPRPPSWIAGATLQQGGRKEEEGRKWDVSKGRKNKRIEGREEGKNAGKEKMSSPGVSRMGLTNACLRRF